MSNTDIKDNTQNFEMGEDSYIRLALVQMHRLLSRMDREKPSKTYGSFDRTFWAWKFTDFSGSRFQEGVYALTWFYKSNTPSNPYYNNSHVLEWICAGFEYWQKLQHKDGSFDEAYPFERSLAATSFTSFYLGEAFLKIKDDLPYDLQQSLIKTFEKAGLWLCQNDERHGVLSNHLAVAAASLEIIYRITINQVFSDRANYFIGRIIDKQSTEGWYEEYGGADIGYQTHGTFYLARYWQLTKDEKLLKSLQLANKFLSYFIHLNGTLGGEYASRNTSFYFPAGYEILASVCENARSIALSMRFSVDRQIAAGLSMMDAYNFCPILNNYLFASDNIYDGEEKSILPFMEDKIHQEFPKAGLVVHVTQNYQAIFAPSKGGVLKIYSKKINDLAISDCGYWIKLKNGKFISTQGFIQTPIAQYGVDEVKTQTSFSYIKQKVMSPWLFIAFRVFMLTFGRQNQIALMVKNILVKFLVVGNKNFDATLNRKILFSSDCVTIEDELNFGKNSNMGDAIVEAKFSSIHMGSSRYFQKDELNIPSMPPIQSSKRIYHWSVS